MAKSIFDRNPLTEMFSSVEEAMRCANSMELNNMLRNSFKGITTDPILGEPKKSKESMSIAIIVGDDSNNLNNINTLENGGKMKKFQYTGRYADGGKKLKPLPADNKGLQALAKKNPKLVMDMGFDPNSVAGKTKGKKKKGPKVPKNQDVIGYLKDAAKDVGETLYDVGEGVVEGVTDFYEGFTENPRTDGLTWVERAELHKTESLPRSIGRGIGGLYNIHPFTQAFRHYLGGEEGRADNAALLGKGGDYSMGMFDYREEPSEGPKRKTPKTPLDERKLPSEAFGKDMDGGMAPNLGAYPDIVYLTRFDAGGKQKMARGYQSAESAEDTKEQVRLEQRESSITNPRLTPQQRYDLSIGDYTVISSPSSGMGEDAYADKTTGELKEPVDNITFGTTSGDFVTIYNPGDTMPTLVPMDEVLLATGEYDERGLPILNPNNINAEFGVGSLARSSRTLRGDDALFGSDEGRFEAGEAYRANIPGSEEEIENFDANRIEQQKDRSNYPYYVFKSAGLDIRDFQKGQFADRSADSNRELRRRLKEHLAAGKSPETFSVQVRNLDLPEGTQERLNRGILTESSELASQFPMEEPTRLEKVPELSTAGMRDFNLADVMSQQQFDKMNELEEKAASGEQLTRRQQRRLNNLQSLYSRGTKASGEERRGTQATAPAQATAAERASTAGQAAANVASGQTQPEMTGTQSRIARRSERLDDRISRAQERADRRADTQALRDEVQSKRQQLRNIRRGMDGMFFNPSMPAYGDGTGMIPGPIMTRPTIPNGGEVSGPAAFNFAADGMMTGAPNMGRLTNTVRGGSTASSTSTLSTALADAVRKGELSPEQAQKMLMILGEK